MFMKTNFVNSLSRFWVIMLILGVLAPAVYAQTERIITGTVTDTQGDPLIGVNVLQKGTTNGSITDIDGNYSIQITDGKSVLDFSYIGYTTQQIPVGNQKVVNVKLKDDTQNLEEVVVIGYGTAKKKDLTGAVSTVRAEKLAAEAPRSVQDILRGGATGLAVGMSTDAKGSSSLQIRGKNTLSAGSSPLIVLDGVIYDGDMQDINPSDIETIDVLKDASSVAVYGAKASNGVVAISTKRGKGSKPTISFNTNLGFVQNARLPKMVDGNGFVKFRQEYAQGQLNQEELSKYPGRFQNPTVLAQQGNVDLMTWYNYDQKNPVSVMPSDEELMTKWLSRLSFKNIEIENYLNGVETNWDDVVFKTGFQQDYTASISNKTEYLSYYWSLGYTDKEGVIVGDRYRNFRTRLNLESKITSFLTVGMNSQYATRMGGYMICDFKQRENNSPYTTNEIDNLESPYRMYPSGDNNTKNPFFDNLYRDRRDINHDFTSNLYAILKLPFGIEYQMNFTPRYHWYEYMNHESSEHPEWAGNGGKSERKNEKIFNWQLDNIIRWKYDFNKDNHIEATFLANAEKGQKWSTVAKNSKFSPSDVLGYHNIGAGTVPIVSSEDTYKTGDALMARLYYSFKNRYMITASIRRDGYSAFGVQNPRAAFPAIATAWTFSSEKFMESTQDWLNYGKLRFSWGQNGNRDIGQYDALASLNSSVTPFIDQNGNIYITSQVYVNRMANSGLKWERTSSYNIGLDYSFLNDRITGSLETYMTETNDLLVNRSLPSILGFANVKANLGKLTNRGFELNVTGRAIQNKNFSWTTNGTFSFNRRKIRKLYGDMEDIKDENGNIIGQKESDDLQNKWFIGHDPDQIWDYVGDGVWQLGEEDEAKKYGNKPGDFRYVDQNNDGVLDNNDKVFQGYTSPRFRASWRNEFTFFEDFSVSFLMYGLFGHYGTFNRAANSGGMYDRYSITDIPRWTVDNPTNEYGRLGSTNKGNHYLRKSFVRMENISFSYNLPSNFLKKYEVHNMRLSLSVRNPFVISGWNFGDPEGGVDPADSNATSGDITMKSYMLGLTFTL